MLQNDDEQFKNFFERINAIEQLLKINDPKKLEELEEKSIGWAPEVKGEHYENWLRVNYPLDPNNALTVSIYSLFTTIPITDLVAQMNEDIKPTQKM